jgi:hypothetical protein
MQCWFPIPPHTTHTHVTRISVVNRGRHGPAPRAVISAIGKGVKFTLWAEFRSTNRTCGKHLGHAEWMTHPRQRPHDHHCTRDRVSGIHSGRLRSRSTSSLSSRKSAEPENDLESPPPSARPEAKPWHRGGMGKWRAHGTRLRVSIPQFAAELSQVPHQHGTPQAVQGCHIAKFAADA